MRHVTNYGWTEFYAASHATLRWIRRSDRTLVTTAQTTLSVVLRGPGLFLKAQYLVICYITILWNVTNRTKT